MNTANNSTTTITVGASSPWGVAALGFNDFFYSSYNATNGRIRKGDGGLVDTNPTLVTNQAGPRCMATDKTSV